MLEVAVVQERNWHELKLPTLILLGELDLFQREEAELLARHVAGARLVVISRGGHLLNLTSPEEFRVQVSQFVRERVLSSGASS
jgi:pimeloyl-ACP methyl ester carboxylesterase